MGHILGFKVLAEGVEMPDQLMFLRKKSATRIRLHQKPARAGGSVCPVVTGAGS
jgi:hypothetical protein